MYRNKRIRRVISGVLVLATVVTGCMLNELLDKSSKVKAAELSKDIKFMYHSSALDDYTVHMVNDAIYNDAYFSKPSTKYNHDLAILSQAFALASGNTCESMTGWGEDYNHMIDTTTDESYIDYNIHRNAYIVDVYKQLGFYNDVYKKYDVSLNDSSNTCAYSIATKDIKINKKKYSLVCVNVRSVNYGSEWGSNFYLNDELGKTGFAHAGQYVYDGLKDYLKENKLKRDVKIWIPAYSRGAGVANVAAALLDKDIEKGMYKFKKEDVYAYMCATPMATLDKDVKSDIYNNIFNLLIESDIVATVAPSYWGFNRYGNVMYIPHFFASGSDIKKIEKGESVNIPDEQLKLMKKVSNKYNEIRHENALNELKTGNVIFDGFRVGAGVSEMIDIVAKWFAQDIYGYEQEWQDAVVDITPFVISQYKKYDKKSGEWVKYETLAEFICDKYGAEVLNKASEAGVYSQSEYNKNIQNIADLRKNNIINDEMVTIYRKIVDTIYGIKIIAYTHGVSVEDIKGFVSRFMEYLPELKQALTPLAGAVNMKKNHFGEFYMAWLQTYNPYTREDIY